MSDTPKFNRAVAHLKSLYEVKDGVWFRIGKHTNPDGHKSNASLLIIAATFKQGGTIGNALNRFGEYADRVRAGEKGHGNVEALLELEKRHGAHTRLDHTMVEFQNNQLPIKERI